MATVETHVAQLVEAEHPLNYIESVIRSAGSTALLHVGELGLVAAIPGVQADTAIMLQAHYDTVDAGEGWTTDPHKLTVTANGTRLQGLGVSDMYGATATYLALFEQYARAKPPITVVWEFVDKEEIDGAGTSQLRAINRDLAAKYPYRGCILGEPTDNAYFGVSHNGASKYEIILEGEGGHSSRHYPLSTTALDRLVALQAAVKGCEAAWRQRYVDTGYVLPVANITAASYGGDSLNKIAKILPVVVDLRMPPSMIADIDTVLEELRAAGPEGMQLESLNAGPPIAPICPEDSLIRRFLSRDYPNTLQIGVPYASDMDGLQKAGWPTVHYGPGDTRAMHEPNETISRPALHAYLPWLNGIIGRFGRYALTFGD